jgi:hypothetical protein
MFRMRASELAVQKMADGIRKPLGAEAYVRHEAGVFQRV